MNKLVTIESHLSKLQLSEWISYTNTKNPIVACENLDNFLTTPPQL